jgi:hypothetical protein
MVTHWFKSRAFGMLVRHRGLIIPGLSPKESNAD